MTTVHSSRFPEEFLDYQEERRVHWNSVAGLRKSSWSRNYRKRIIEVYREQIPEGVDVLELGCGLGELLSSVKPSTGVGVDLSPAMIALAQSRYPNLQFYVADVHDPLPIDKKFDVIILSDLIGDVWDLQRVLQQLRRHCRQDTRLFFNFYNRLWQPLLSSARALNLATPNLPQNWFTQHDVENLLELSEFEPLRDWAEVLMPVEIPVIGEFANKVLSKLVPFRWWTASNFLVARPLPISCAPRSVSVVIPARNEAGHIAELMARIPKMGESTEIIFVEGNSNDNTWIEIQSVIDKNPGLCCRLLKQSGKGKGDAVRMGFSVASGDILMILDADITVPPEDLPRFYDVLVSGKGDFANGVRLVYPMQEEAMRFLNLIGNKFFSWAFSWLLGQPIRDTLCGTKVIWARDYQRLARNRGHFGDFDPFGDFDLLFGAAKLNLKIMEVPVRYRNRRYGDTNIHRWRHGFLLLRMVIFAARRIKFI